MIKRLLYLCFILIIGVECYAQQYGNEWINYSQKHYRISIPKTGLYRIDSLTLANAGIVAFNPKNIQLFIKGVEQYVYIKGETDNVLNANDYIEFYAEKNDGHFDSLAYNTNLRLPNPYFALFNDTNYAYITFNTLITNKRTVVETDVNYTGYTPEPYFYREQVSTQNVYYSRGDQPFTAITDPRYVKAEGYGTFMPKNSSIDLNILSAQVYTASALPVIFKASFSGDSRHSLIYDHRVKIEYLDNGNSLSQLHDTTFFGYQQLYIEKQLTSNQLQTISQFKLTSVNDPAFSAINNVTNMHYMYVKYPQTTNLLFASEQTFLVNDNTSSSKAYLDIQNVGTPTPNVIIYDLTNHKYIQTSVNVNNVKALIPNSGNQKKCFLTNEASVNTINKITPVNQTGFFVNYNNTLIDSAFLIVTHKGLQTSALQYKAYRESSAGGNNQVIMAYIDDLYDQFAYGNTKNPLAIKNFCKYLSDSLHTPPKYLLLIGKSIKNDLVKTGANYWNANAVPTMGIPASDNLLTTGIHGQNSITPFIPVGRVSALTNLQVLDYLDKITSHEGGLNSINEQPDWRKRVLHFAGGTDAGQQQLFEGYLNTYSVTITDTLFGGTVKTFRKNSTAPIQITISDSVKQLFNYGAAIVNFFGHASVSGFDQAIDNPSDYNNKDKYPLFIANSCYSGDIHGLASNSTSESFTLYKDGGSIGFLASSSLGLTSTLHLFSTELYHSLAYYKYYKGVGDAIQQACFKNSLFNDQLRDIACLEMTYEGDPSVKINAFNKPDYEIKNSSISFNTSAYVDSIGININIKNLGKAINDTFIVRTERYFPSGDSITFLKKIKAPYNASTLSFFILKDFEKGVGINRFKVIIDAYNKIPELSEMNNATNGFVDLFIAGGDVVPVYPYKYAIIPNTPQVTLKASTADPFASAANYKIQLDTNDTFSNPINFTTVNSVGGIIEWTVNLPLADSTVYFWRITKDSSAITDKINWRESSFQVIGTKRGWAQAHFHQFKNDGYQFVKYKRPTRNFVFENDIKSLECNDGFYGYVDFDEINYKVNNSLEDYWTCSPGGGWSFAVFDSISAKAWESVTTSYTVPGNYNNCVCYAPPLKSISFGAADYCNFPGFNWKLAMENFLNSIPVNNKILAWSIENNGTQSYSNSLYQQFESFGSSKIRTHLDTLSLIIFGTKGAPIGSAHEEQGTSLQSKIQLRDTLKTRWNAGFIASEIIGPSYKWRSLHWKQQSVEAISTDSVYLQLVGIKTNGVRDTLARFNATTTDVLDLYNYADALIYPRIQLIARVKDNVNLSPPQLKKWQVIYDEVPECAINPKKGFAVVNDTLQEGDKVIIRLPIENIGVLPFTDSLLITYSIEDKDRVLHVVPKKLKVPPFVPNQVIIDTIQIDSYQYPAQNYLWVDVNPPANTKYQLEQYHFNNIARIPFVVNVDRINPLLDVTFDGTHILNGDIISAKPHVLITLKDENKFLALNDTSNFAVYIRYPNQQTDKRIFFTTELQFTPANLPNNSCKIEWMPEFAVDGKYMLLVQARDRSRNVSGAVDYRIQFEVVNKQTITEVLNYPNPFSTSTRFVFTLTGSELPDIFTIQIMTITGKVVREINKNEFGNLHIGRNITDYAWDGKDEYGDKLGNGVYLYRVITRYNGQAVEKSQTDADSFFKKGIGKLVIMR